MFANYFNRIEYFLNRKKGISFYNADSNQVREFSESLDSIGITKLFIKSSDISRGSQIPDINVINFEYFVFFQDLDIDTFKTVVEEIVNKLIYPVYYKNIPIAFFTSIDKNEYANIQIKSGLLHTDSKEILRLLFIEQIYSLLSQVNITYNSISNSLDVDINYTPIESITKKLLEENNISYKAQVKLGRHYVDFLIERGDKKLIIECDGREYHNPNRDFERDKELNKFGTRILRLTGSEIFNSPSICLEKIEQSINVQVARNNKSIDSNLDDSQKMALNHITGPSRVLAPAGSGKTKTLVNRIAHLINEGIDENKILALAFNKKAADEMSERLDKRGIVISKKLGEAGVSIRTFHSFGFELIRDYLRWQFNGEREIIDTRNFIKQAYTPFINVPGYKINDTIDKMLEALRKAKMELIPVQDISVELDDKIVAFDDIFYKYLEIQKNHNFFNFDDMIYLSLRILLDNRIARNSLQNRFQYILIDEFQDLNEAQLLLMEILSLPNNNLFIVGDDDQMIYGWRGAKISHILNFPQRYVNSKDYTLSTNYRCTKKVVKHSSWLIQRNKTRVPKDIKPKLNAEIGEFQIEIADNLYEQAVKAVDWIREQKEKLKINWKEFAVLYRFHEFQFPIAMLLDSYNIPHTPINNYRLFAKNPGKDLYSYLTVLLHPNDAKKEDFERILKRPNKYFTNELISNAINWDSFINLYEIPQEQWRKDNVRNFIEQITAIKSKVGNFLDTPEKLVSIIFETFNFKAYYKDQSLVVNEIEKAGDDILLEVIVSVSKLFNSISDFYSQIYNSINEPYERNPSTELNNNEVQLTTIHSTKGKEFTNVVYFNLSQYDNPQSENQLEEERRVCYVGVTRAIKNILITTTTDKHSTFLTELIRNPEFLTSSTIQLNNLLSQVNQDEKMILGKIEHLNKEIESVLVNYPELKGDELQINKNLIGVIQKRKVEQIENKYPELKGKPLKVKTPIFKNYFINQRLKRIEISQKTIDNLKKEIEQTTLSEIENRKNKVSKNAELVDELNAKILNISDTDLIKCRDKIIDIKSEIYFREIFPLNN